MKVEITDVHELGADNKPGEAIADIDYFSVIVARVGVFIDPAITDYGRKFVQAQSNFATIQENYVNGFFDLPFGHPSDKK
jgi:hypothetical protein